MAKQNFTAEEKLQLLLESLKGDVKVSDLCRRANIWPNQLERIRERALQGALEALKNSRHWKKDPEKEELKAETAKLKEIILSQAAEIELLKKKSNSTY